MRRGRIVAALAVVALPIGGLLGIGYALSRPAPARLGAPPGDLGGETVRIPRTDGAPIIGWLTRGFPGQGAVLLLHPLRGNRTAMVTRARLLRRAGYSVLLVDLPAHGESGGDRITFGAHESEGARAALAYLRRALPGERVGALGASLGGASLLLGSGEPAANAADALVLEAVYPTVEEAVADRLRIRFGPFGPPLTPLLTWQLQPQTGVTAEELRPVDRVRQLRVPLLVIAGEADRHTTLIESQRFFAAAPQPKTLWIVPRAPHGDLYASDSAGYENHVLTFFAQYLRSSN
jgi:pimeloyl-ACP methyl ester carboxylesterase